MDIAKLMNAKKAWTLYNLLDELQERLFEHYERDFIAFMKDDYNTYFKIKTAGK